MKAAAPAATRRSRDPNPTGTAMNCVQWPSAFPSSWKSVTSPKQLSFHSARFVMHSLPATGVSAGAAPQVGTACVVAPLPALRNLPALVDRTPNPPCNICIPARR
eukprot:GGOE01030124.1.p4 GENE.GGOE01030124.1~~GGOE01030124.1.p4  ORF type:complete len:105 (-),score=6.07 GGOE01030124.1:573-887(-)